MVIYLDTSALFKLVREEDETAALVEWLALHPDLPAVTSELGRVEVIRAAHRAGDEFVLEARAVVADLDLIPLSRTVQDAACDISSPLLRTLDAVHIASALLLGGALSTFVAYDQRLVEAALAAGLTVLTPGRSDPA